ncbi:MAG TPA: ketopantoate reductase C-terminal domain-containing protein [Nevskiaceae bacterium]|nr:ketopantoate reductase C-terminal domain-containing protein [Nevskiaceae bacterium]
MILIVGAGAVGTTLAAYWAAAGKPVGLYARPKDVAAFEAVREVRVEPARAGGRAIAAPRPAVVTTLDLAGVQAVVIGVKYPALDGVIADLPERLPAGCTLVSTLNGMESVRRLRERFPGAPVAAMSVMFNAQLLGPLHTQITTRPEIVLGSREPALVALLGGCGLVMTTAEGEATAWGKLLINLANPICALTHLTFRDLFLDRDLKRVYTAILDEATGALGAAGIRFHVPLLVPYTTYRWMLLHGGPLPWWFAKLKNGLNEKVYPSMVSDVEAGRPTEIDQLNGEIVRVGREAGFPTPLNAQLVDWVQAARGQAPPRYRSARDLRLNLGL